MVGLARAIQTNVLRSEQCPRTLLLYSSYGPSHYEPLNAVTWPEPYTLTEYRYVARAMHTDRIWGFVRLGAIGINFNNNIIFDLGN